VPAGGGVGVDPGSADLGVPEDALDHVQVYVPFAVAHLAVCRIIVHLFGYLLREIRAPSDHLKNASRKRLVLQQRLVISVQGSDFDEHSRR